MASSSKSTGPYDVFLSFRGMDVRNNFVGHLYRALVQNGIHTFRDSEELSKGDNILMLMKAIEESCFAIIIFSEDYASSWWCLEEVAKIMDCKEQKDLTVLPVFYKVHPKEVRGGRASYARGLAKHESKHGKESKEMKRWKKALFDAGNLSGWTLNDGEESELIRNIVEKISTDLHRTPLHVAKHPVGIESRMIKLKSLLNMESNDKVVMVGLWGQGGIGKTTLAKALYNATFRQFEGSCFLANVRETSKGTRGLATLQEILLNDILLPAKRLEVSNVDGGINQIQHRLGHKKVLLILDDVNDLCQLHALVGEGNWFGNGSRIVITTRDKQLLTCQCHVHEVKELDDDEARELLSNHAFLTRQTLEIKTDLVDDALSHAKGLPLALEVLGSSLRNRREREWRSTLNKLSKIPNKTIIDVLKISYDGLEENEREIFLHIACFFKGWDNEYTMKVLDSCDFEATIGVDILVEKSLISFEKNGSLKMHDLIEAMGMDIVNQECRSDPGSRSRLWLYEDVLDVLSRDKGNYAVKAIVLKPPKLKEIDIDLNAFTKMRRLKLLIVLDVHNSFQGRVCLPNELRWLHWAGRALWIPEFSYGPKKLVGLDMRDGSISVAPKQFKDFQNLKYMIFRSCESLVHIPDLSCTPNLEELDLVYCKNLVEAHESIAYHDKLQVLNLRECSKLSVFPNVLKSKNLHTLNLNYCEKLERFPEIPHKLEGLKQLFLQETAIIELPTSIENLVSLEIMDLGNCKNLVSLPSSIYKLQNIEDLAICGCTNLIGFPKYEDSTDPFMETGHSSLQSLDLAGCNMSKVEFLENPSCFPFLRQLNLAGSKITSLPTSINKRDQLSILKVSDCHQLQEIPELPPSLNYLWADNCELLQKNGDLTSFHGFVRRVLTTTDISSLGQDRPNYSIFVPGGEMPQWVVPVEASTTSFMASKDLYDKFLGFALCVVFGIDNPREVFSLEIVPCVNGERRDCHDTNFVLASDHIWFMYLMPSDLWGAVDFGQSDGSYVQFSLTVSSRNVKMWGFRVTCKPLEDNLKVLLQDNQLMDQALLYEVAHELTDSEAESSLVHEDSPIETDLKKDLQECQLSTEEHGQIVLKRNHKVVLPQGKQTPVQPPEVQSPTSSGEQTNARSSSAGDSAADMPEPEPINDASATGSGTVTALTSTVMSTTSTASMPSQGAVEMVDLPSARPVMAVDELTSESSDVEISDLEVIDKILGAVKPICERPYVDDVRAKWDELYQITKGGYSQIASISGVEDRIKNLLAELISVGDCFTKTPEFQHECEEFATLFANGIEVFRHNCDKVELSTTVEESFNKLEDRLKAGKEILKEHRSSYQAAIDKKAELTKEKERLETLLAEVERQIELNHVDIRHEGRSMKQQLREVDSTMQECDRQQVEVHRHLSMRRKCIAENNSLDERLSTFRRNVKELLDDM